MRTRIKRAYKKIKKIYAKYIFNKNKPYLEDFDRIYHVHIRKSAGTSINSAFWALSGLSLKSVKRKALLIRGKYIYVRNNEQLIEDGNYFYANSHIPFWNLNLPKNTFIFCMLRDPYERLLSLYRYLLWVKNLDPKTALSVEPYYKTVYKQTQWLGNDFNEFLDNLPDNHLQNQLYIFSKNGDVQQAIDNIKKLNAIYYKENFNAAIEDLSQLINIELTVKKEREFGRNKTLKITKKDERKAREKLSKEYQFFNSITEKFACS